ncbi:DUF2628 domain-containing protein [Marinospirillum perlucidum]|uniref:DUF2628 domain-containing protein n=1 Tax=Marinospirillum perlucidum TaxID=1982602 RepID=UPI000DF319B2|nr:DUF2628 domain-containing protein [Marinospirillum perlucidum]
MTDIAADAKQTDTLDEAKLLEAYIQKPEKIHFYQSGLEKMQQAGAFGFRWHWSWWAFFFGWAFLLYRKAYLPALGAFVFGAIVSLIPFGFIIAMIVLGGSSSYFILKRYNDLKNTLQGTEEQRINAMHSFGGYHTWVIWVGAILYSLAIISILFTVIMTGGALMGGSAYSGY